MVGPVEQAGTHTAEGDTTRCSEREEGGEIDAATESFGPCLFVPEPTAIGEQLAEQGVTQPPGLASLVCPGAEEPSSPDFQAVLGTT